MLEALTEQQIVETSKKWQEKVSSGKGFSIGELFDLASDVLKIRYASGLAQRTLGEYYTGLTIKGEMCFVQGELGHLAKETLNIFVPLEESAQVRETFSLEKITNFEIEHRIDENFDLVQILEPRNITVSMRESVAFQSLLDKDRTYLGNTRYEDQREPWLDYSASRLATAIWNTHLIDAPLKNEFLHQTPTATV